HPLDFAVRPVPYVSRPQNRKDRGIVDTCRIKTQLLQEVCPSIRLHNLPEGECLARPFGTNHQHVRQLMCKVLAKIEQGLSSQNGCRRADLSKLCGRPGLA